MTSKRHDEGVQKYLDKGYCETGYRQWIKAHIAVKSLLGCVGRNDNLVPVTAFEIYRDAPFKNKHWAVMSFVKAIDLIVGLDEFGDESNLKKDILDRIDESSWAVIIPTVLPDAWVIKESGNPRFGPDLHLIEVRASNRIKLDKMRQYSLFADNDGYEYFYNINLIEECLDDNHAINHERERLEGAWSTLIGNPSPSEFWKMYWS